MLPTWIVTFYNAAPRGSIQWSGVPDAWVFYNPFKPTPTGGILEESPGMIAGVTTVTGTPASQRVRVYRRSDGALVGETLSAEDGTYQVTGLDPDETHYVVALHTTLEYNAVVADNITPENPA